MALLIQDISTEYLPVLDNLMMEYFNPSIDPQRKNEIKQIVNTFACEDNSWSYAMKFLMESKSDYTKVYCFGVLHSFILKNWLSLTEQVKNELKDYILNNLVKFHIEGNHSLFIQNKLCQIITTIVRLSFPQFWPNYFDDLANLMSNLKTIKLGIRLLNITLEELLIPSEDMFEQRKNDLNKLISNQVPMFITILSTIMRSISIKYLSSVFVTPPASPIESIHYQSTMDQTNIINTNNNKQINLKSICLSIKDLLENIDSESLEVLDLIMRCNLTLINWISINDFYPLLNDQMLELLFIFATFGCSNGQKETTIGILTLTVINELLSKNYIYNEFSSKFYFTLFDIVLKILLIIDNEIDLENLDQEYLKKFMDSMNYFVSNQIVYNEENDLTFFFNFLEKLFNLTFKPKWSTLDQQLIEIWINMLDIFINHNSDCKLDQYADSNSSKSKLFFASSQIFKQLLFKLQYRFNSSRLEELDTDCNLNDDCAQNESQIFFNIHFELLSKITRLIPNEAQKILSTFFEESVKVFLNMDQLLGQAFSLENKCIVTDYLTKEDANNLDYTLKDLTILIRLWQRLSEHLIGTNYESSSQTVQRLLDQVLSCLSYSNRLRLFTFNCDRKTIVEDLNELHQSLLLILKFYSSWINQFRNESNQQNEQNKMISDQLIKLICGECVHTIMVAIDEPSDDSKRSQMYSDMIVQSSLLSLLTVSCSIKPCFLLKDQTINTLFDRLNSSINSNTCPTCLKLDEHNRYNYANIINKDSCLNCKHFNLINTLPRNKCTTLRIENAQELIWIDTFSNILLLPWSKMPSEQDSQDWEKRSLQHKMFIYSFYSNLIKQFRDQPFNLNERIPIDSPVGNTLKRTLFLFTNLINNHIESPTKSKQILLASLIEFLEFIGTILPINILNDDLGESILSFLISAFEVFRSQIKLPFIDQVITTLLDCIGQNSLLYSKPEFKNSLVEKVFKIFIFIVEQPNASFKMILPRMLDVALDQMYQTVVCSNCNDLYSAFYEFLYKFLLNNSKFFFRSSIGYQFDLNNSNTSGQLIANGTVDQTANQQYFFRIFEIFGNSFVNTNMHLFKQNLSALHALNYRQKLFYKQIFKQNLLHHFILLFIQTLITSEHKILQDELINIIYALAGVDYEIFKKICLFEFVAKLTNCPVNFNQHYGQLFASEIIEDSPTFNRHLLSFISGVRFYRNSNCLLA